MFWIYITYEECFITLFINFIIIRKFSKVHDIIIWIICQIFYEKYKKMKNELIKKSLEGNLNKENIINKSINLINLEEEKKKVLLINL